jgi:microcompartment protein CcmL/EutN
LRNSEVEKVIQSIGFLELNSIAKGIEATDAMLKASEVSLVFAKPNCPGKYNIMISGDVAAVKSSIEAGLAVGGHHVIEHVEIPRVHPQVIKAINFSTIPEEINAVGILEYFSITASILGADSAVKAADVNLIDIRLGTGIGGKSFVVLTGDTAAVTEAVETGAKTAGESGMLISRVVIPNPRKELFESLL